MLTWAAVTPVYENARRAPFILAAAIISGVIYAALATLPDLRRALTLYLVLHAVLAVLMLLTWRRLRRQAGAMGIVLVGALLFRLVAALGAPTLSDDVYRYVWDGRVQLSGHHPYAHAPVAPVLSDLRDDDWSRINHPELKTIYPPLAQIFFLVLAATGSGVVGIKLALGLLDFAVVLLLARLLARRRLPADRVVLYAWNPLAVMETAGSGHVEPLGALLVLVSVVALIPGAAPREDGPSPDRGWRGLISPLALAGAIHAKLLPVALLPARLLRSDTRRRFWTLAALVALALPYALTGPVLGGGLFAYAERWEYNAFAFAGLRESLEWLDLGPGLKAWLVGLEASWGVSWLPWEFLQDHVWPPELARGLMLLFGALWILALLRARPEPGREALLVLGGLLLLMPTFHPWYMLWVLPLAAAYLSPGFLYLGLALPLAYTGSEHDVSWLVRCVEYLPTFSLFAWTAARIRKADATRRASGILSRHVEPAATDPRSSGRDHTPGGAPGA